MQKQEAQQAEAPERGEATKDGPESSRRRPRKSLDGSSIPGMPHPQMQSPEPPKPAAAAPAATVSSEPVPFGGFASGATTTARRKIEGPPPLLMGEFSVDDVLLWLEASAFKKRPPLAQAQKESGGREAYRSRIFDELRDLKARVAQTAVEMEA